MVNFSERIGAVKANRNIQIDSVNDELQNSLWNLLLELYEDSRSLSVLLMFCPAQSERYFCSMPLNTAVFFNRSRVNLFLTLFPLRKGYYLSLFRSLGHVVFLNYTRCTRDPIHR